MDITINTAQNVGITYKPAGLMPRIIATVIDLALLGGVFILGSAILLNLYPRASWFPYTLLVTLLSFYHLVCEYFFNGQSIGKATLRLRVVRLDNRKLSFWDCLLRWVLRLVVISSSSGVIAMVSIILTSKAQRLGDLAANTTVIQENPRKTLRPASHPTEETLPQFPQVAILSDRDINIIREVCREAEKTGNLQLYAPLAAKIKTITGIQTDLADRDFIRTILTDYIKITE